MPNIAAADLVGDSAVGRVFGTEVSLFLDDDDDAVAYQKIKKVVTLVKHPIYFPEVLKEG